MTNLEKLSFCSRGKAGNQRKSLSLLTSIPALVLVNNPKCISFVATESKEDVGYKLFESLSEKPVRVNLLHHFFLSPEFVLNEKAKKKNT